MDHKEAHHLRLYVLAALFFIVAAVYIGVLYDTQVNNYDYYYASPVRSIARSDRPKRQGAGVQPLLLQPDL